LALNGVGGGRTLKRSLSSKPCRGKYRRGGVFGIGKRSKDLSTLETTSTGGKELSREDKTGHGNLMTGGR